MAALLSLLAPFPYSQDFRPYFTIHDPAFARLALGTLPTPTNGLPLLLGITNMYFLKVRWAGWRLTSEQANSSTALTDNHLACWPCVLAHSLS